MDPREVWGIFKFDLLVGVGLYIHDKLHKNFLEEGGISRPPQALILTDQVFR